jgi:hypothetical protein
MANYAKDCGGERYKNLVRKVFEVLKGRAKEAAAATKKDERQNLNDIRDLINGKLGEKGLPS